MGLGLSNCYEKGKNDEEEEKKDIIKSMIQ